VDDELCICGSGRPFRGCHGLRGRERRGRGHELQALGELHDLGLLFPFVRPRGVVIGAFADRVASAIGETPRDTSPTEAAEGVRLLSDGERRRLVRSWAGRYPERWRKLCAAVGDTRLGEVTLVASAVRGAVADRVSCPRELIAELEEGIFEDAPVAAVALVLAPPAVWSFEDVVTGRNDVNAGHVARARTQVGRLRRRLPLPELPRASATLIRGCDVADDDHASGLAALLFDAYCVLASGRASYIGSRN
jgi:hypothetical protein